MATSGLLALTLLAVVTGQIFHDKKIFVCDSRRRLWARTSDGCLGVLVERENMAFNDWTFDPDLYGMAKEILWSGSYTYWVLCESNPNYLPFYSDPNYGSCQFQEWRSDADAVCWLGNGGVDLSLYNTDRCQNPVTASLCLVSCKPGYGGQARARCPLLQQYPYGAVSSSVYGVWQLSGCANINECLQNPCHPQAVCTDTVGSFVCTCNVTAYWQNDPVAQGVDANGCMRIPCQWQLPRGSAYGSQCNELVPNGPPCKLYCTAGYGDANNGVGVSYTCPGGNLVPEVSGGLRCSALSAVQLLLGMGNLQYEVLFMVQSSQLLWLRPEVVLGDLDGDGLDDVVVTYGNALSGAQATYAFVSSTRDSLRIFKRLSAKPLHTRAIVLNSTLWGVTEQSGVLEARRWAWPPPVSDDWSGETVDNNCIIIGTNCSLALAPRLFNGSLLFTLAPCPAGGTWSPWKLPALLERRLYAWPGSSALAGGTLLPDTSFRALWGAPLWQQGAGGVGLLGCNNALWLEPNVFGSRLLWSPSGSSVVQCLSVPSAAAALAVTSTGSLLMASTTGEPSSGTFTVDEIAVDVGQVHYCSGSVRPRMRLVVLDPQGRTARVLAQNPVNERAAFDTVASVLLPGASSTVLMRVACLKLYPDEREDYNLLIARLLQDAQTSLNQSSFLVSLPVTQMTGGSALRLLDRCAFVKCAANATCELLNTWPRCRCAPGLVGDGARFCVPRPPLRSGGGLYVLRLGNQSVAPDGARDDVVPVVWRCPNGADPLSWCTARPSCTLERGLPQPAVPKAPHYYVSCPDCRLELWYNTTTTADCYYQLVSAGWPVLSTTPTRLEASFVWSVLGPPPPAVAVVELDSSGRAGHLCYQAHELLQSYSCAFPFTTGESQESGLCSSAVARVTLPCGPESSQISCALRPGYLTYRCRANSSRAFVLDGEVDARALSGDCEPLRRALEETVDFNCSWPLAPAWAPAFCEVVPVQMWRLACSSSETWCAPGGCVDCPSVDLQLLRAETRARASGRNAFWEGLDGAAILANYPWLAQSVGGVSDLLCHQCFPSDNSPAMPPNVLLQNCPYACTNDTYSLLGAACSYHDLRCSQDGRDSYVCWSLTNRLAWLARGVPTGVVAAAATGYCRQLLTLQPSELYSCRTPQRLDLTPSSVSQVGGCVFLVDSVYNYAMDGQLPPYYCLMAEEEGPQYVRNVAWTCGTTTVQCALTAAQGLTNETGATCAVVGSSNWCHLLLPAEANASEVCARLVRYCVRVQPDFVRQRLVTGWLSASGCTAVLPPSVTLACPSGRNVSCGAELCLAQLPAFVDSAGWWRCAADNPWARPPRWGATCAGQTVSCSATAPGGRYVCSGQDRWRLLNCTVDYADALALGACEAVLAACPPDLPHQVPRTNETNSDGTVVWTTNGWRWSWPRLQTSLAGRGFSYCELTVDEDVLRSPVPPACAALIKSSVVLVQYCSALPVHCFPQDFGRALQCVNECELSGQCQNAGLPELRGGGWWLDSLQDEQAASGCWLSADHAGDLCPALQAQCTTYCGPGYRASATAWSEADCVSSLFHEQRFRCGTTDLVCDPLAMVAVKVDKQMLDALHADMAVNDRVTDDYLLCHNAAPSAAARVLCPVPRRTLGLASDRCGALAYACAAGGGTIECDGGWTREPAVDPFCTSRSGNVNAALVPCDCGVHWTPVVQALAPGALIDSQCYLNTQNGGLSEANLNSFRLCTSMPPTAAGLSCAARGLVSPDELVLLWLARDVPDLSVRGLLLEHSLRGTNPRASNVDLPAAARVLRRLWAAGGVKLLLGDVLATDHDRRAWCLDAGTDGAAIPSCALRPGLGLPLCTVHCPVGTTPVASANRAVRCCNPPACCWLGTAGLTYSPTAGLQRLPDNETACRPNLFAELTAYPRPTADAVLAPSDAQRQLCFEDVRCQAIVLFANGGVFFSERELNFPLAELRRLDPGRLHQLEADQQGTRYLHPVPERELAARGDTLVTSLQSAVVALDRRVNQACSRFNDWSWSGWRPAALLRARLVLQENWRALAGTAGLPRDPAALPALAAVLDNKNETEWRAQVCGGNSTGCAASAWVPTAGLLSGYAAARLAVGYYLALLNLTVADGLPGKWIAESANGRFFSLQDHRGVTEDQLSLVERALLRVDLVREVVRDAFELRNVYELRRGGSVAPMTLPEGCGAARGACGSGGAWPGSAAQLELLAQAQDDLRAARWRSSAADRFRPGDHAIAVAETRSHTLLRYFVPAWFGGARTFAGLPGRCDYDAPWGGPTTVPLTGHEPLSAGCDIMAMTWPWQFAAYWNWRQWVATDAFSHGTNRWSANAGNCSSLSAPLWRNEPVLVDGQLKSCYLPRCPQPVPYDYDWYAQSTLSWSVPDTAIAPRDTAVVPCGWDRGLCGSNGRCLCNSGFRVKPNTDTSTLVYDAAGEPRVARVLMQDACDIDGRGVCKSKLSYGSCEDCSGRGVCVADFRADERAATCRCAVGGICPNGWTSSPYGQPASCNIPPAGCFHSAGGECKRAAGASVDRGECFGCELPRASLLVPGSETSGSCLYNRSSGESQCGKCDAGYFGRFCEYVTLREGCYNNRTADRQCVWNWYLGQYEEAARSTIDADLLAANELWPRRGCAGRACNGNGQCTQTRAFPLDAHDFDHLPPLARFSYRVDRFQLAAYLKYAAREERYEAAMRAAADGQACRCDTGFGGRFCQDRVCAPACHVSATCYYNSDGRPAKCLCAVDRKFRCLRPEGERGCSCQRRDFPANKSWAIPTKEVVCGPGTLSALVRVVGDQKFPWACSCQAGATETDSGQCKTKVVALADDYGTPPQ